jgi:cystathionine gamma-lyase
MTVVQQVKVAVVKIGGSVLTGPAAYDRAAEFIAARISDEPDTPLVVVVSAEHGLTDALFDAACALDAVPDPTMRDLLWSTGELRSVALLALRLQALGVLATGVNVHQTGLLEPDPGGTPGRTICRPSRLLELLDTHDVVVAPGFLARGKGDSIVSLGRGGSDLTAVVLALGLNAMRCELVKDVPGYFSSDPNRDEHARHLPTIDYATALAMASDGCELVQQAALEAAGQHALPIVVRSMAGELRTEIAGPGRLGHDDDDHDTRISGSRSRPEQKEQRMEFATRTIHAEQPSEPGTGSLVAPIFQTSTYEQEAPGVHQGFDYSRTNNPTRARLEAVLADLEGVNHAAVFASGLAAENAVLQAWLKPGDEVIIPRDVYGGTYRLLTKVFQPLGCLVRQIDVADEVAFRRALSDRTRLVWIESPTNPRLLVYDIAAIAAAAHAHGALVVVDNTFATPLFQQPFQLGADIVVHSVTKYLAGHSDLIQGAVLAKDAGIFEPIKFLQNATGAVPSPFDCWLTLRGLKTMELRVLRHAENAAAIADALSGHPRVGQVYYPGLSTHPGHAIARRQMTGFGGMVSFELDGSVDEVVSFVSSRRFFALGESLGGVKALVCHPARMTHASIPASERATLGLSDTLVRLSPGCEHHKDLVADLLDGLAVLQGSRAGERVELGV